MGSLSQPAPSSEGVNVMYMGLPAHHPIVIEMGYDPLPIDEGVQQDVRDMINAGYNVYILWAGPEIPMDEILTKIRKTNVDFDLIGVGIGVRASMIEGVIHFFEDLIDLFHRETPNARMIFNTGPGSCLESVRYRMPLSEEAGSRVGTLLGYDFAFDGDRGIPFELEPKTDTKDGQEI